MKKAKAHSVDELRSEYKLSDFTTQGVRGKYLAQYRAGTNIVRLSRDVAAAFPNEQAVNTALRSLLRISKRAATSTVRSTRAVRKRAAG